MSKADNELRAEELARATQVPRESVLKLLEFLDIDRAESSPRTYRDLLFTSIAELRKARAKYILEHDGNRVLPEFPSQVQIQTLAGCNAACPMCAMSTPSVRLRERGRMPTQLFDKIIAECSQHDECEEVALYLQNEPLLDIALADKIKAVKVASKGRLRTRIVTNGSLLSQEKINSLIDAGLDAIAISLNAKTARTYHKVMGGLEFERTVKNIESLLKVAPPTMLVTLTFMVTQDNEHEVADAVEYWARRGVFCAAYGINTMGGMVSSFEDLRPKSAALYDPQRPKECYLPIENAAILVSGDVLLCCTDWSRSTSFGNLTVSRLSEVWHSQLLSNVRLAALTGRFPCKPCQSCPGQTRTMDNLVFYGGPGGSNANI